jgi:LysM repeat protein
MILMMIGVAVVLTTATVSGAPRRYSSEEDNSTVLREIRDNMEDLRHEVRNHEAEIRIYDEKLGTMESSIDTLRQQINETHQANKDVLKENSTNSELKLTSVDTTVKGLVTDLRQLKTHANDSAIALGQYKQKLLELEKIIEAQSQNIENLQAALKSMMDAMQVKSGGSVAYTESSTSGKTYRVRQGDSLEKIARSQGTNITALKEVNNLSNDKIIVGQNLRIP